MTPTPLARFDLHAMSRLGAALRKHGDGAASMEEVAGRIVGDLHRGLTVDGSAQPACILVRLFKTHHYGELPREAQAAAARLAGAERVHPRLVCLTLLATAGDEAAWNHRSASASHQAIPLAGTEAIEGAPMIAGLVQQFGLDADSMLAPTPGFLVDARQRGFNVFHVETASRSPYVPAQHGFVDRYGVRSVLGFGGMLPSGSLFAVIMFSRETITRNVADLFQPIALNTKLALLPFDDGPVFAPQETIHV